MTAKRPVATITVETRFGQCSGVEYDAVAAGNESVPKI